MQATRRTLGQFPARKSRRKPAAPAVASPAPDLAAANVIQPLIEPVGTDLVIVLWDELAAPDGAAPAEIEAARETVKIDKALN